MYNSCSAGFHAVFFRSFLRRSFPACIFHQLRTTEKWHKSGAARNCGSLISKYYTPILVATEPDYQIRLLDIGVLVTLVGQYDSLTKFLTDFALDPLSKRFMSKTMSLIDEGEDKPLTVSTIHSAKGLEWYGVIIPHALDGMIPSIRAIKNLEEMEEERRLFYVACSRAKEDLTITMPSYVATYKGFMSYPSRFLVEIEKDKFQYQ